MNVRLNLLIVNCSLLGFLAACNGAEFTGSKNKGSNKAPPVVVCEGNQCGEVPIPDPNPNPVPPPPVKDCETEPCDPIIPPTDPVDCEKEATNTDDCNPNPVDPCLSEDQNQLSEEYEYKGTSTECPKPCIEGDKDCKPDHNHDPDDDDAGQTDDPGQNYEHSSQH